MQELIGNLTADQFTQFIGVLLWSVFLFVLGHSFAAAVVDGWAFRKGSLYYSSLRCLNKGFKKLKTVSSLQELDLAHSKLCTVIRLLRCQRAIPKIMYIQLENKCEQIWQQRRSELWRDEYIFGK